MTPCAETPRFHDVRAIAESHGAAPALEALAAAVPPPGGVTRHLLLPKEVPPPAGSVELRHIRTDGRPLILWRTAACGGPDDTGADDDTGAHLWWLGITWVRLGLCERLLAHACSWLRGRRVGDQVTLNLPPVRLIIADAALAHAETRGVIESDQSTPTAAGLALAGTGLDRSLRLTTALFGASGYIDDRPGRLALSAEMLGHIEGAHRAR